MADYYDDFDLDRATASAWEQFTHRLDDVLSVIDPDGELTISTRLGDPEEGIVPGVPWVRASGVMAGQARSLLLEAPSNRDLDNGYQLTVEQLDGMSELGWQDPTAVGENPSPYFHLTESQEESGAAASLLVRTLRDVFGVQHPAFLAPDQLAEVLQPAVPEEPGTSTVERSVTVPIPADATELSDLVTADLTELFGHPPFRDSAGDIAIRVGSTIVFVRTVQDAAEVLLFSVLVHDVEGRSRAVEILNDLNTDLRFGRFALHRDKVFVSMSLFAKPYVSAHLRSGLKIISDMSDAIDEELAEKLRGHTTFPSPPDVG